MTGPITATSLTADRTDSCSSIESTASVAPSANKLILVTVGDTITSGTAPTVTLTGNGLTWVEVTTTVHSDDTRLRATLFRSMGAAPSSAPLVMTFSQNPLACSWSVVEFGNVDSSGTDGSGAIAQSAVGLTAGSQASLAVTLGPFASTNNAVFGVLLSESSGPIDAGLGFAEIHEVQFGAVLTNSIQTQWRASPASSVDWSWSSTGLAGGVALEIARD